MWNLLKSEWLKLRRCQILLVGIVALTLCPVAQYGSQLILDPALRDPNYDFPHLFANVLWGNTQVFLPISLVMTGGWLIDREYAGDIMKNLLVVPVSPPKLLTAKLGIVAVLAVVFGVYSTAITLLTGMTAGLAGLSSMFILRQGICVVWNSFLNSLVCMPLILLLGQIRGAYLGGSILTFFLGYSMMFFKSGILLSAYPFSAVLVLSGFDMVEFNGAKSKPDPLLSLAGIAAITALTGVLLSISGTGKSEKAGKNSKISKRKSGAKR